ncbi:MAG: ABC transporter substrate-binding protein [Dehalococcoidia bacterium]
MNVQRYGTPQIHRRRLLRSGAALAAGSAAFLLACGDDDDKQDSTTSGGATTQPTSAAATTGQTPTRGSRLKLNYQDNTTNLNPAIDVGQRLAMGAFTSYDRLISQRLGKDTAAEYVPEAAQSVEQPDSTTVIFTLKPGLTFHPIAPVNGRAMAAEDVVASQLYLRDEVRATNRTFQVASMQSAEAPDAQTVVFKLKAPNAYLFSSTQMVDPGANCIFPKEIIPNLETVQIGSGPYQLVQSSLNERYLYKRFDGFRDARKGLPYVEEREFLVLKDPAAQEAAFRSDQLSIWQLPDATYADRLKQDTAARIELDQYDSLGMMALLANVTKPPWNDVRVREAIYRLTNHRQYVDLLEQGNGKIPPGPMQVGLTEYQLDPNQTEKYFRQDPRAARQLLEAAGFDFNREVPILQINRARDSQAGEIMQQQFETAGIKSRVTAIPFAEWLNQRIRTGDWEAYVTTFPGFDCPHRLLRWQHTTTNDVHAYAGIKDPQIDAMIEKSEVTLDRDERVKLVKDIQTAALEKYTPFIYVYHPTVFQARWKYVRDYEVNPAATLPMYRTELWLDQ